MPKTPSKIHQYTREDSYISNKKSGSPPIEISIGGGWMFVFSIFEVEFSIESICRKTHKYIEIKTHKYISFFFISRSHESTRKNRFEEIGEEYAR